MSAAARFNTLARSRGWTILCCERMEFDSPRLKDAAAYWRAKCSGRAMPTRSDLSPVEMKSFLSLVGLADLETDAPNEKRWRVRLHGSDLDRLYGSLTGRYIDEVIKGENFARWMATIDTVVEHERPLRFLTQVELYNRDPCITDTFLAPLSSTGEAFDMLFSVTAIRQHDTWARLKQSLELEPSV